MARRKNPVNEAAADTSDRKVREDIANHATRSEKVSWERQLNNMEKLLADEIQPIESKIIDLLAQKSVLMDRLIEIRDHLTSNCIHPAEHVVYVLDAVYECKFCGKRVAKHDVSQ